MVWFPSAKKRDAVLDFLTKYAAPINEIADEPLLQVRGPTSDPAYSTRSGKNLIGYDFTLSSDLQSRIAHLHCYWMLTHFPTCRMWYDGIERMNLPVTCDKTGYRSLAWLEEMQMMRSSWLRKHMYIQLKKPFDARNPAIKAELKRLTGLCKEKIQ